MINTFILHEIEFKYIQTVCYHSLDPLQNDCWYTFQSVYG